MQNIRGLATGIGSLPHADAKEAVELIFKYVKEIPFWPQLPKSNPFEGMTAQFGEGLPCLEVTEEGILYNPKERDHQLEHFYSKIIDEDLDYFRISERCGSGLHEFHWQLEKRNLKEIEFIKCHITGPFTFAASIKDEQDVALLHDEVFMQVVIKALAMKALWQIKQFSKFGKKIILFIDEPYLSSFGSAYAPITREQVVKALSELTAAIKSTDVLVGVHCCGNTDWSIFTEIQNIDIINFDAFSFLDKFALYAQDLSGFLKRSGIVCWGIVPTQEFSGKETAELLAAKLQVGLAMLIKKGVEEKLLEEQLLISPSCGLGTLTPEKAQGILGVLAQVSALIRNPR